MMKNDEGETIMTFAQITAMTQKKEGGLRPSLPEGMEEGVVQLVRESWASDVVHRPSFAVIEMRLEGKFRAKREITLIARGMKLTRLCSHASVAALLPALVEGIMRRIEREGGVQIGQECSSQAKADDENDVLALCHSVHDLLINYNLADGSEKMAIGIVDEVSFFLREISCHKRTPQCEADPATPQLSARHPARLTPPTGSKGGCEQRYAQRDP